MKRIYLILLFLLACNLMTFSQSLKLNQYNIFFKSSIRKLPLANYIHISFNSQIKSITKNNQGDTIQIVTSRMPKSSYNRSDSLEIFNFKYDSLKKIISIESINEEGKPYCYGVYDTDISWSKYVQTYDTLNRPNGYKWFTDTILSDERKLKFDNHDYIIEDVYLKRRCHGWDTIIVDGRKSLTCKVKFDTITHIQYSYSNNYHTFEINQIQFDLYGNEFLKKNYTYTKIAFDSLGRQIEESQFSNGNGERQLFEYNNKNNLSSIRFCDIDYRLRNHDYDDEGFALILYLYKRNGRKLKSRIFINKSGKILDYH